VATRVLKFWSEVVLDFRHTSQTRIIKVSLEKNPKHKRVATCHLAIKGTGICDYDR